MARTLETPRIPEEADAPSDGRKWLVLVAMVFGLFMPMLDNLVVNVALPTIQHQPVVSCQRAADALVHHGQALVGERLIVHHWPPCEKAAAGEPATALAQYADHQKVTRIVADCG